MPEAETQNTPIGNADLIPPACEELSLPTSVVETSKALYREIYDEELYHGRPAETVVAGCIYVSSRVNDVACNPTNIGNEFDISREEVLSTARHLMKGLDIELQPIDPEPYVEDFTGELELEDEISSLATDIISCCKESGLHSGKSPTGFAAGAVYAAIKLSDSRPVTQKDISQVSDVSTVTIRNQYQDQIDCYRAAQSEV